MTALHLTRAPTVGDCVELLPLTERIREIQTEKGTCVIALDGFCSSGKTTIASALSTLLSARVIHMDDFFLPPEKRTHDRLSEPGGNVDYERFYDEVICHLSDETLEYGKFDCAIMKIGGRIALPHTDITIVEGSYSLHPYFKDYANLKVFTEAEYETQLSRILSRNGEQKLEVFKSRWIPMEMKYFTALKIPEKCDFIIKT